MIADDVLDLAVRLAGRPLFFDEAQADEDERWLSVAEAVLALPENAGDPSVDDVGDGLVRARR